MERARGFVFTLNNYTEEEVERVKCWDCKYLIFGREIAPSSGTPHLQGYVYFANGKTLRALKKYSDRAHWEIARGSPKQASEYCEKDGDFFEKGERPLSQRDKGQTEVDRWKSSLVAVEENRLEDIPADICGKHLKQLEYAAQRIKLSKRKMDVIDGEMEHEWCVGEYGCGKSYTVRSENPGAFVKDPETAWWDGYLGEDVVIIEDVDKVQAKMSGHLKRWIDRYPFQANIKNSYALIRPRKVVVTSQYYPSDLWNDEETVGAIMRRVKIRTGPWQRPSSVGACEVGPLRCMTRVGEKERSDASGRPSPPPVGGEGCSAPP